MDYIRVLGQDYALEESETLAAMGQPAIVNHLEHEILFPSGMNDEEKRAMLVHEIFEILLYRTDMGLEHWQVTTLASTVHSLLCDNPELIEWYADEKDLEVDDAGKLDE